jgi:hypothetical protein
MRLVISSRDDLEQTRRLASWVNRPAVDHVLITLPWLDVDERQRIAKELEAQFNACGCTWGTVAFVLALVWCLRTAALGSASVSSGAGYVVLGSVTAAIAGKALGLKWSQWRLKVAIRRMSRPSARRLSWH